MRLHAHHQPLVEERREIPKPQRGQLLLRIRACAVCRTDLHVIDGELANPILPIVPGHEIVGEVVQCGADVDVPIGARMGVPWLGFTCGVCEYCRAGRENLCPNAKFTGFNLDGGFAEHVVADARYCFAIPEQFDDEHAAPLLCAGLIGYRSLKFCVDAHRIGIYGFGAAAHVIAQVARWQGREIYAFTRVGDVTAQRFALELGARWSGSSEESPPEQLDAAIIFAPIGALVPLALQHVRKAGTVVCGGIHMSDIPSFPYSLLWEERIVRSVANLTRQDAIEFLRIAAQANVQTHVTPFALRDANEAIETLRAGEISGAAVLVP
ncbi:MAG TPA: zinc-dependent alcohol dehydrogenase family protein [Steroidobacteraceae bacterium]|nr:zinc-dependent alcohol dehydrogenase family protein [Steroidobacteraceae bacterium]